MKRRSLYWFRDWLFNLLMDYFINSGWIIIIKDFKKPKKRSDRNILGEISEIEKAIYLDKIGGTPSVLVHELCHFGLGATQEKMSEKLPWKELKKVKGKRRLNKEFEWRELNTLEFEKLFYHSLNKRQIRILQGFIDEAQARYRKDKG